MMTKNEAWATMVAGINCPDVSPTETMELIQLDAYKAGMTKAAEIAKLSPVPSSKSCGNDHELQAERGGKILMKDDIIVAIEQARDNTITL